MVIWLSIVIENPLLKERNVNCGICSGSHRFLVFHQSKIEHQFTISTPSFVASYNTAQCYEVNNEKTETPTFLQLRDPSIPRPSSDS